MFWNGLTLGCLGIYLLHNVVGGNWGVVIRRFVESGIRTLPLIFCSCHSDSLRHAHAPVYLDRPGVRATKRRRYQPRPLPEVPFFIDGRSSISRSGFLGLSACCACPTSRTAPAIQRLRSRMQEAFSAPGLLLFVFTTTSLSSTGSCRSSRTGFRPFTVDVPGRPGAGDFLLRGRAAGAVLQTQAVRGRPERSSTSTISAT